MCERFITLAIESSCDDTALAVLNGQREVLSSALSSQVTSHSKYGGVVPELASRMHQEVIISLLCDVLAKSGIKKPEKEINLIAVTSGPGLMGSLLVGVMTAKALSQGWSLPLIGVNHLEGHIFANVAAFHDLTPPFISVIVSGGHTELVLVKDFGCYELLGSTRDDAAGEAYDKVAKILGLGYPGGPIVDKLAALGNDNAYQFPVPLSSTKEVEFSFSGLKTAVVTFIQKANAQGNDFSQNDICASFQKAVTASITGKISLAVRNTGVKKIALSGGVAANSALRAALLTMSHKYKWQLFLPPVSMCTDNAVMIAAAGYNSYKRGNISSLELQANPSWELW